MLGDPGLDTPAICYESPGFGRNLRICGARKGRVSHDGIWSYTPRFGKKVEDLQRGLESRGCVLTLIFERCLFFCRTKSFFDRLTRYLQRSPSDGTQKDEV